MVSECFGYLSEYRGVTETPWEVMGLMGHRGERGKPARGAPPHGESESEKGRGCGPHFLLPLPLLPPFVATRPQTVKSLCFSVIPGSVMLTHTVLEGFI